MRLLDINEIAKKAGIPADYVEPYGKLKAKIDMNKTRNLIIASLILTIGIGGAIINFGKFSLAGIGLASIVGVILNLIIPDKEAAEAEAKTE